MITDIRLQNFRSYKDAAFELDPGVNIVVGPNASGKTNLLEALLVVATGKSYRAGSEELVMHNKAWARLEAHTVSGSRVAKIDNSDSITKSFEIDKQVYRRLPANKKLPIVLFEPQHLLILTGRPERRRDYLDDLLEQTDPAFGKTRRDYKRALAQRNVLLKRGIDEGKHQLFAWNIRLSQLGGTIADARKQLIKQLNQSFAKTYKTLSTGKTSVELSYSSSLQDNNYVSHLLHKLENDLQNDFQRGFTAYGPHRDDLAVKIGGQAVADTASRGEVRTIVLALKVLEVSILQKLNAQKPIILLDDVFSELDGARRQALTKYLDDYQTFITTTDADLIAHNFAQKCNIISLA